jgi:predicted Zn-dependent protease
MSSEEQRMSAANMVHSAWDKLQAGDTDGALTLLASVERDCQGYSSYHVVLASALLTKKAYSQALGAAEQALRLTPASPHAKLIAEISRERMQASSAPSAVILREDETTIPEEAESTIQAPKEVGGEASPTPRRTLASLLDPITDTEALGSHFNIDKTADELTRERPLVRATPEPEHIQPTQLPEAPDAPALVSETLAEIMIRQGKLTEAKKVYIQLARLQPERYGHFKTKIEAIDKLLLGTSIAPETTASETTDVKSTDTDPVA